MKCIFCGKETKVVDSRPATNNSLRRRRECLSCKKRFTTYERSENKLIVRKKDGRREAFSREKLRKGIVIACGKRPIGTEQINKILDSIENQLMSKEKSEISSRKIGELVVRKLKRLDPIAYIRFSSVYKNFDIRTIEEELKKLKGKK